MARAEYVPNSAAARAIEHVKASFDVRIWLLTWGFAAAVVNASAAHSVLTCPGGTG